MKLKEQLIAALVETQVADAITRDQEKQKGYGSRIARAGELVLREGVKALGNGEYEVDSGTTAGLTYIVNGACHCPDAEKGLKKHPKGAPAGFCKHRMAVVIHKKVQEHLKELAELRVPHPHRWDCDGHRELEVVCWQRVCPDPFVIACPTCQAAAPALAELVTRTDDEDTRIARDTDHLDDEPCDDDDSPYTEEPEEPTMLTTLGSTITHVLNGFHPTAETSEPAGETLPELPPLVLATTEYEPAPVILKEDLGPFLPEAGASLNIKVKVENFELMYTMRGHQDGEVLERLPTVLATLERLMKTEVDHDESFMKRLLHAFFPKPSRYTGK
jgi:hypothetical protein